MVFFYGRSMLQTLPPPPLLTNVNNKMVIFFLKTSLSCLFIHFVFRNFAPLAEFTKVGNFACNLFVASRKINYIANIIKLIKPLHCSAIV